MNRRPLALLLAVGISGCAKHASSSAAGEPAAAQPLTFIGTRGRDSLNIRYRGMAYTKRGEIDIVLREGSMPVTGPFMGAFRGLSVSLASGEPGMPLRVSVASDRVDVQKLRFANGVLADSVVFRIRHVTPESLVGKWIVVEEWRLWHSSDGTPELAPVEAARSTDVFRAGHLAPASGGAQP